MVSNLPTEQAGNVVFHDEMQDIEQEADDTRFNEVDDDYLDELANEIHKKRTKTRQDFNTNKSVDR